MNSATSPRASYLTPPQYAAELGTNVGKVLSWIARGELRATNLADRLGGRPRWRISPEARDEFERRRERRPEPPAPRKKTRRKYYV